MFGWPRALRSCCGNSLSVSRPRLRISLLALPLSRLEHTRWHRMKQVWGVVLKGTVDASDSQRDREKYTEKPREREREREIERERERERERDGDGMMLTQ